MTNFDPTPWAIGGGAENSPETARTAVFASTNGASGVVGVGDLKVTARDVPGSSVQMAPGALLAVSRYAGADRQTYTSRLGIVDYIDVANTGSSGGRRDCIAVLIDDPSQTGDGSAVPADPTTYQYVTPVVIPNVSASVKKLQDIPGYANVTGYAIALVNQPANNGTVTNAMITDLRRVANPRKDPQTLAHAQVQSESQRITSTTQAGQVWPSTTAGWTTLVPEWATRVQVVAIWSQVQAPADGNGTAYGRLWVRLGAANDANVRATQENSWDTPDVSKGTSRQTYTVVDDIYVPAGLRGREIPVNLMARRANAGAASEAIGLDAVSGVSLQLMYVESAD